MEDHMASRSQPCADANALALKACPFCGGAAEIVRIGNDHTPKRGFEVHCTAWGCATKKRAMVIRQPIEEARRYAVEAWNTRAGGDLLEEMHGVALRAVEDCCETELVAQKLDAAVRRAELTLSYVVACIEPDGRVELGAEETASIREHLDDLRAALADGPKGQDGQLRDEPPSIATGSDEEVGA